MKQTLRGPPMSASPIPDISVGGYVPREGLEPYIVSLLHSDGDMASRAGFAIPNDAEFRQLTLHRSGPISRLEMRYPANSLQSAVKS
jgi:hypothetical protein